MDEGGKVEVFGATPRMSQVKQEPLRRNGRVGKSFSKQEKQLKQDQKATLIVEFDCAPFALDTIHIYH